MRIFRELPLDWHQQKPANLGLVPTMGALHEGHAELIQYAQKHCKKVLVSIFVNPKQFNNPKDLETYPRVEEHDLLLLERIGVDYVWLPTVAQIYTAEYEEINWDFQGLDSVMEGEHRPGHFNGVAEVVRLLFEKVQPYAAFFGEKDYQQLQIIRKMNEQLNLAVKIKSVPIVRESSGLAYSSRNMRLDPDERASAVAIYNSLVFAKDNYVNIIEVEALQDLIIQRLTEAGLKPEYVFFAEEKTLQLLGSLEQVSSCRLFIAAYAGEVRLIDNMKIF